MQAGEQWKRELRRQAPKLAAFALSTALEMQRNRPRPAPRVRRRRRLAAFLIVAGVAAAAILHVARSRR